MDEWGVKVNFAEPRSAVKTRALAWVVDTNPGWGGERLRVYARSRGGRMIDIWIATKHLTNLRAAWMPEHLRDKCRTWATREEAEAWAKLIAERWANAEVRGCAHHETLNGESNHE